MGRLCDILNLNATDIDQADYILQFLSVPCTLEKLERQRILRKHKSNNQQNTVLENRERNNYMSMSPAKKQAFVKKAETNIQKTGPRQAVLENLHLRYKEMDPANKQNFLKIYI